MSKGKQFISDLKLYTDYLKWDEDKKRYETWEEAVDSVLRTHSMKYGEKIDELLGEVKPKYNNKEILASQRNLQFREDLIMRNNCKLYNCCVSYCYSPDVFSKGFFILLSGTGLGVSMRKKFTKQLPDLIKRDLGVKMHVVEDSIEGWANASKILMSSFCKHESLESEYLGYKIKFDYSNVRPKGAFITGGFRAPGPDGLKQSLERIEELLDNYISDSPQKEFKSIIAYDIFMHLSDAVLSGGVRRSAMNIIMDNEDTELINAKTGDWRNTHPWRARSNNSIGLLRNEFTKEDFEKLVALNEGDNDLGFVFMSDEDDMFNPCVSGDSLVNTPKGLYLPENLKENTSINLDGKTFSSKPFKETGIHPLLEFKTSSGRKIKVTNNHIMFTDNGMKTADSLRVEDNLIISNNEDVEIKIDNSTDSFKKGYLVGSFIGDGNFSTNTCEIKFWDNNKEYHNKCLDYLKELKWTTASGQNHKKLLENKDVHSTLRSKHLYNFIQAKDLSVIDSKNLTLKLMEGDFNYVSGILSGYFDADGTVIKNKDKGNSLRITSNSLTNLETCQVAFNSLGIYSKIYNNRNKSSNGKSLLPDGKGGMKEYNVKDSHELCITKKSIENFQKVIPLMNSDKSEKIDSILDSYKRDFYKTDYVESIVSIENKEKEIVYDCEVQTGIEAFECNGFRVHNCFEISFNFYNKIKNKNEAVFQFCNLTEINASACKNSTNNNFNEEKFYELCRSAAILGTLQAGYFDFPYLGKQTEDIVAGEALLGVSITGWMTRPELFNEEILVKGAEIVKSTNVEVADIIGINHSARTTTVKPSGNACTKFDTKIKTEKGDLTLEEIFNYCLGSEIVINNLLPKTYATPKKQLKVYDENNELKDITSLYSNGLSSTYEIEFEDGNVYEFTGEHKLKTTNGWKFVKELSENDEILSF